MVPLRCNGQPAALNFADDVVRVGPLNMKLNSQDLKKIAELTLDCYNQRAEDFWEGTRLITTLARTSRRCCGSLRTNGLLRSSILAADRGVTLGLRRTRSRRNRIGRRRALRRAWRAPIAAAKYGSRIFSSLIYRATVSMVYSPTQHPFTCLARSYRVCCGTVRELKTGRACYSVRTRMATTRKAGMVGATACIMILRLGAAMRRGPDWLRLMTITARLECRRETALAGERLASERSQLLSDGLDRRCKLKERLRTAFPLLRMRFIPRRHRRGVIGAFIHEPKQRALEQS